MGGGDERERRGLEGGPEVVVTNLCVIEFEPASKAMRLVSVHPGVTVDQVQAATGFDVLVPEGGVPETPAPTSDDVRLIREIDPGVPGRPARRALPLAARRTCLRMRRSLDASAER